MNSVQSFTVRQRWLVVDDQPDLSELMADVLAGLDCASVENFTDPSAAFDACTERAEGFDLVVTDRDMPGINGWSWPAGFTRNLQIPSCCSSRPPHPTSHRRISWIPALAPFSASPSR